MSTELDAPQIRALKLIPGQWTVFASGCKSHKSVLTLRVGLLNNRTIGHEEPNAAHAFGWARRQ
jgi:hypothetical protein